MDAPITAPTHRFAQTISTQRRTDTLDSGGSPVATWTASLTSVAANVQLVAGSESVRYGRTSTRRLFRIYLASGQDIVETDRILFDSRLLDILEIIDFDHQARLTRITAQESA